jgi:mannosyltransferase
VLAAILMAVNAFLVHFAQEARGYSLVLLLTTTASYLFLLAVEKPSPRRWGIYIVVSALSVYVHLFAALVIAAHALSLVLSRRRPLPLGRMAIVYALIGVATFPLVWLAWGTGHLEWITKPTLFDVRRLFLALSGGNRPLLWIYFGACAIALVSAVGGDKGQGKSRWSRVFLLSWLLVPVTTVFLVSITLKPMFSDRYFLILLPPLVLLVAAGLDVLPWPWLKLTAFGALLAFAIRGLLGWYAAPPAEDWRVASAYVLQEARQGDVVAFEAPYVRIPFEYYLQSSRERSAAPDPLYPSAAWGALDVLDPQISRGVNDWPVAGSNTAPRIWVVQSHILPRASPDEARMRVPEKIREQYRVIDDRKFRGVRVLLWAQDTSSALVPRPGSGAAQ